MSIGTLILGIASVLTFFIPPIGMLNGILCLAMGLISYLETQTLGNRIFIGMLIGMVGFTLSAIFFFLEQQAILMAFTQAFQEIQHFPAYFIK